MHLRENARILRKLGLHNTHFVFWVVQNAPILPHLQVVCNICDLDTQQV